MQIRWNFKLLPNQSQGATLEDWLVTLRKHRNYALKERNTGFETNNKDNDTLIVYVYGSYCDLESKVEYGSCCPLTCPVLKHGVIPKDFTLATKQSKVKDKNTKETVETVVKWDSASGIQMKVTTHLRKSLDSFARVDSNVLQRNIAKLDTAFSNFYKLGRGYPSFIKRLDSIEYKPGYVKLRDIRKNYATAYLPGIGDVKFHNSRDLTLIEDLRTCTITRKSSNWYISMLVNIADELPAIKQLEQCKSVVGIDVGINKLVALSDGSFVENKRTTTNKKTARRLAMRKARRREYSPRQTLRQHSISRKLKGSKNRTKAIKKLAKQQHKLAEHRNGYNWQVAKTVVNTADVFAREDLKISNMAKRAKPKRDGETALQEGFPPQATANPKGKGGFKRNGASRKTGLNKVILDAAWGDIFNKITWLALKAGKPVIEVNPRHTSQECPKCGHIDKKNRNGEKFLCTACGHVDHADTKASRTIAKRVGLIFPNKKILPAFALKVTPSSYQSKVVETGNQAYGVACYSTVGYLGDTAKTPKESPSL